MRDVPVTPTTRCEGIATGHKDPRQFLLYLSRQFGAKERMLVGHDDVMRVGEILGMHTGQMEKAGFLDIECDTEGKHTHWMGWEVLDRLEKALAASPAPPR